MASKPNRRKRRGNGRGSLFQRKPDGCWIASWKDANGKRRERSTRTTQRAAAERILAKILADVALRREGVIDMRQDRFAAEGRKPLADHLADYIAHCERAGQAALNVQTKQRHLEALCAMLGDSARLSDLTADALEGYMSSVRAEGRSARTANLVRQIGVAFASWAVKTGRAESNALRVVPRLDESRDRRRVRRPLTDKELAKLIAVARTHGRDAWYLAAAMAGLRKGDLQRLTWADVDFDEGTLTLRHGKAKREDVVPMHPQLADALKRRQADSLATPRARVFPETVTDRTRLRDFLRAGLAREEVVTDDEGKPVMIGEGEDARAKLRIVAEDDEGRVIDLHALRTTLGTNLARAGVAPQLAQRIMRHSDYRTTLKHYTVLGLADTSKAIDQLPGIQSNETQQAAATGTDGPIQDESEHPQRAQQCAQQRARKSVHSDASQQRSDDDSLVFSAHDKPRTDAGLCATMHRDSAVERTGLEPATPSLQS